MAFGASAIVTGAASGLGRAAAAKLASRGAGVVIFDLPNSAGAEVAKLSFTIKIIRGMMTLLDTELCFLHHVVNSFPS